MKYTIIVTTEGETPEANGIYASLEAAQTDAALIAADLYRHSYSYDDNQVDFIDACEQDIVTGDFGQCWVIDPDTDSWSRVDVVMIEGGLS